MRPTVDQILDDLDWHRLERMRRVEDFPLVPSPRDEYLDWPYPDEDEDARE
jgi:hypothetical protein